MNDSNNPKGKMDYDLIVIGGGINGTGIAREAAYQGYRTLLLEKDDFGAATSGQSTKMIHGGIRYLETGDFHLVYESLHERATLLKIAPNLVQPLRIVIPIYNDSPRSGWIVRLGTLLYDLLAGRKNLSRSRWLKRKELTGLGGLRKEGLRGAIAYSDGQVQDSRLCLENALSAKEAGATVLNYHRVENANSQEGGFTISGTNLRSGKPFQFTTQSVVNASGPWCPFLEKQTLGHPTKPMIYDRGIHIVVPSLGLEQGIALMLPDRRLLFVLPWQENYTLIGTTETHFEGEDFTDIPVSEEEIDYLLKHTNDFFPDKVRTRSDIVHYYSGVRTLVAGQDLAMTKLSREADIRVFTEQPGTAWLILYGGKLTSYRALAEEAIQKLSAEMKPSGAPTGQNTKKTPLYGGGAIPDKEDLVQSFGQKQVDIWKKRYGSRWIAIAQTAQDNSTLTKPLVERFGFTQADLAYMVTQEMAFRLEDITLRRTKMGYALDTSELNQIKTALKALLDQSSKN